MTDKGRNQLVHGRRNLRETRKLELLEETEYFKEGQKGSLTEPAGGEWELRKEGK